MLKYNKAENQNTGNQISLYDQEKQYSESDYQQQEKSVGHNLKTLLRHRMDTTAYFEFTEFGYQFKKQFNLRNEPLLYGSQKTK
jgi:hypothetical protein